MKNRELGLIACLVLLFILPAANAHTYSVTAGETERIVFYEIDCKKMEILRYEDVPVETFETTEAKTEYTEQEWNVLHSSAFEDRTSNTEKNISPIETEGVERRHMFRENSFKVFGPTKRVCPAMYDLLIPAEEGFYYIPVKLDGELNYIGFEVKSKVIPPPVQQEKHFPWYLLLLAIFPIIYYMEKKKRFLL